jgi:hypothetical protein
MNEFGNLTSLIKQPVPTSLASALASAIASTLAFSLASSLTSLPYLLICVLASLSLVSRVLVAFVCLLAFLL